jgi:hypothetical protein
MTERRYNDEEVSAIFAKAAEGPQVHPLQVPQAEGLTLAELQEIGREVGITPEAVALAVQSVDQRGRGVTKTLLGMPVGVERTVTLDRELTDKEWDRLVVQLREVFGAQGRVSSTGTLRQWTNGNLQALLEPTSTGQRLRLRTVNGSARGLIATGVAFLGVTAAVAIAAALGGQLGHAVPGIALLASLGLGMVGNGAVRLPGWAKLRGRQMEEIAAGVASSAARQLRA